jgi:hypothetical protein
MEIARRYSKLYLSSVTLSLLFNLFSPFVFLSPVIAKDIETEQSTPVQEEISKVEEDLKEDTKEGEKEDIKDEPQEEEDKVPVEDENIDSVSTPTPILEDSEEPETSGGPTPTPINEKTVEEVTPTPEQKPTPEEPKEKPEEETETDSTVKEAALEDSDKVYEESGESKIKFIENTKTGIWYEYKDSGFKVKFSKIDQESKLIIDEIKLSDEQIKEFGSLSKVAYDVYFEPELKDGTFEYELEFPVQESAEKTEIKYAENKEGLEKGELKSVEKEVKVQDNIAKTEGLDHFTTFVVTSNSPADTAPFCIANSTTPTSDCFNTLVTAVAAASSGDTIKIENGNYTESSTVNIGGGKDGLVIEGESESGVVITNTANYGFSVTADNVTIKNVTIETQYASSGYHIKIAHNSGFTIENVTLNGNGRNSTGLDLNTVQNVTVKNVEINNYGKNLIAVTSTCNDSESSENLTFENIDISKGGWTGMAFYTESGPSCSTETRDIKGVDFKGTNSINNSPVGLYLSGVKESSGVVTEEYNTVVEGTGGDRLELGNTSFTGNGTNIINWTVGNIGALNAVFDGVSGVTSTSASIDNIESKLLHDCNASPYISGLCDSKTGPFPPNGAKDLTSRYGSIEYAVQESPYLCHKWGCLDGEHTDFLITGRHGGAGGYRNAIENYDLNDKVNDTFSNPWPNGEYKKFTVSYLPIELPIPFPNVNYIQGEGSNQTLLTYEYASGKAFEYILLFVKGDGASNSVQLKDVTVNGNPVQNLFSNGDYYGLKIPVSDIDQETGIEVEGYAKLVWGDKPKDELPAFNVYFLNTHDAPKQCTEGPGYPLSPDLNDDKNPFNVLGTTKNGDPVEQDRSDIGNVVGEPDGKFLSLGKGGSWIFVNEGAVIKNIDGPDLSFHEVTNGRGNYPEERLKVEVSQNLIDWVEIGEVSNLDNGDGVGLLSLPDFWTWARYVRVIDVTNYDQHIESADGYDLDAIDVKMIGCGDYRPEPIPQKGEIKGYKHIENDQPKENVEINICKVENEGDTSCVGETQSANTDSEGYYEFTNLDLGIYKVWETLPIGFISVYPYNGVYYVALYGGTEYEYLGNLVGNGGFEQPVVENNKNWEIYPSGIANLGWQVSWHNGYTPYKTVNRLEIANLELHKGVNGWNPAEGSQYAELDTDWDGPNGSLNNEPASVDISQKIPVCENAEFFLSYEYSARPNHGNSNMSVNWGGLEVDNYNLSGSSNVNWQTGNATLLSSSANGVLSFTETGTPDSMGMFLDNIEVYQEESCDDGFVNFYNAQIPEPEPDYGSIEICKFNDLNGDGQKQDTEEFIEWEVGVEGLEKSDYMDNGCYVWDNVEVGEYTAYEKERIGWKPTMPTETLVEVTENNTSTVYFGNQERYVSVLAQKIVCDYEQDLPNWGAGGPKITATTAQDFVDAHFESCRIVNDWNFQWAPKGVKNPGDNTNIAPNWNTFSVDSQTSKAELKIYNDIPSVIQVREALPEGYLPFTGVGGSKVSAEMYCGTDVTNYDNLDWIKNAKLGETYYCVAFNTPSGSIKAIKYEDLDGNGEYNEQPDSRLSGWTMTLYNDNKDELDSRVTDNDGRVVFNNLPIGDYTVCETLNDHEGWVNTDPGDGDLCKLVKVRAGKEVVVHLGNAEYGKILVSKYQDVNRDGRRNYGDASEPGLEDWSFILYNTDWDLIKDTQQTGPNGWTTFKGIEPGKYIVCEQMQEGWASTDIDYQNAYFGKNKGEVCQDLTLQSGETLNNVRFGNYPLTFDIVAQKVVCDLESDLPNWGNGGDNITENTAQNWVTNHESCRLEEGWSFQWGTQTAPNPGDNIGESLEPNWSTFGPTDSTGTTKVTLGKDVIENNTNLWFREINQTGFVPFTFNANDKTNIDNISAEVYCHTDVANYDNWDRIDGVQTDQTYYCVAFNSPTYDMHGFKYNDLDNNGEYCKTSQVLERGFLQAEEQVECEKEPKMGGWTIFIDENNNQQLDEGEKSTVTEPNTNSEDFGWYWFKNLPSGDYSICEVQQEGWTQTFPESVCHSVSVPYIQNKDLFTQNAVFAPEYNFGNHFEQPKLSIAKFNNVDNGSIVSERGGLVQFTITVKATENFVNNVIVTDLPAKGFTVLNPGTWTAQSSTRGTITVPNPNYASPGDWELGNMEKDEVVTITYNAQIDSSQQPGLYKDLAYAVGTNPYPNNEEEDSTLLAQAEETGYQDTNFVGTAAKVDVSPDTPESDADIDEEEVIVEETDEGDVLGASTSTLPATGSPTWFLLALAVMFISGLIMVFKGFKFKTIKSILFVSCFLFLVSSGTVSAAGLSVRVEDPKTPTNAGFNLSLLLWILREET